MNIRTTVEADLDTILALIERQSVNTVTLDRYRDFLADRTYRHDWTWVVEEAGEIVALAIWWGPAEHDHPFSIDGLYYAGDGDPVPAWTALIEHTLERRPADAEPPEYHFFLASDWKDQPDVVAELGLRRQAAEAAGLTAVTERLRYDWKPEYGLPPRSTRLRFEPADDEAFVDVFRQVAEGSLDAATALEVARIGLDGRPARAEGVQVDAGRPGLVAARVRRRRQADRVRNCPRRTRAARRSGTSVSCPSTAVTATATTCWPRSPTSSRSRVPSASRRTPTSATCRWPGASNAFITGISRSEWCCTSR